MNTNRDLTGDEVIEVFRHLDRVSRDAPIGATLTELQLVIERMSFSGLADRFPQNDEGTLAEVDLYFRDEVSPRMVHFVRWMAEQNWLGAIANEKGRIFLDRCVTTYRKIEEVQFLTAVELSHEDKAHITSRLRVIYPHPARILFATSPLIVAGFVLQHDRNVVVDKSLRSHVVTSVNRSTRMAEMAQATGGYGG